MTSIPELSGQAALPGGSNYVAVVDRDRECPLFTVHIAETRLGAHTVVHPDLRNVIVGAMQTHLARLTLALATSLVAIPVHALELPETSISYTIEVSLDPATRRLDGRETVRWTNPSSRPIDSVPMHLYLNAFAHEDTTWMRGIPPGRFDIDQMLESGTTIAAAE